LLCASIDRNFDKFEIYVLRNIFTVRPPELRDWMRLSHYEGLDFSSSITISRRGGDGGDATTTTTSKKNNSDAPTIESVTALRRRLRESMRLNALLTAERARNEALLEDLRRVVGDPASSKGGPQIKAESTSPIGAATATAQKDTNTTSSGHQDQDMPDVTKREEETKSPFAFLHQKGDLASSVGGEAPLATTAAFTLSQMQSLRALSSSLRKLTPDLAKATPIPTTSEAGGEEGAGSSASSNSSKRSWRRERVEYVETATRRHLETVHGLELGEHGEVRDGEWQGPGRNLARGEVEGLERIVAILGGEGGDGAAHPGTTSTFSVPVENADEDEDDDRMDEL
jgi:kinetochore protein Mis12/MTW1